MNQGALHSLQPRSHYTVIEFEKLSKEPVSILRKSILTKVRLVEAHTYTPI